MPPVAVTDGFVGNCVSLAAAAVILYDYLLTIHQEFRLIWQPGRRTVMALFLANRTIALCIAATLITTTFKFASVAVRMCKIATYVDAIAELPLFIVWSIFNSLRVHAIGGQKRPLTALVFLLSMMPFAMNVYYISTFDSWKSVITGKYSTCSTPKQLDQWFHVGTSVEIVTRGPLMIADMLVIGVTWKATYRMRTLRVGTNLVSVMLWDGTLYFMALLLLNAAQLAVFMSTDGYGDVSSLVTALSSIIIARFLLSLRDAQKQPTYHGDSVSWSGTFSHSLHFPANSRSVPGLRDSDSDSDSEGEGEPPSGLRLRHLGSERGRTAPYERAAPRGFEMSGDGRRS